MSDDDLPTDAGDDEGPEAPAEQASAVEGPKQRRKREIRGEREFREAQQFWATALADEVGRREIWKLLQAAHTFEERFACGPNGFPQVEATWFHAGEQAFGQRFYRMLSRIDRAGVLKMHDIHDPEFPKAK